MSSASWCSQKRVFASTPWCSATIHLHCAVIFKPLYKCFIHTLRAVNPEEAARVEASPPQPRRGGKAARAERRASEPVPLPRIESHLSGPYRVRG